MIKGLEKLWLSLKTKIIWCKTKEEKNKIVVIL